MWAFKGAPHFSQLPRVRIKHLSHVRNEAWKLMHHAVSLPLFQGLTSESAASRLASSECRGEPKQTLGLSLGFLSPPFAYIYGYTTAHLRVYHPSWVSIAIDWPDVTSILSAHLLPVPLPWALLNKQCLLFFSISYMSTVFLPFPLLPLPLSIVSHSPQICIIHICVYMYTHSLLSPFSIVLGVFTVDHLDNLPGGRFLGENWFFLSQQPLVAGNSQCVLN